MYHPHTASFYAFAHVAIDIVGSVGIRLVIVISKLVPIVSKI